MAEHYCTYFDHRFAAKGLAMWKSLKRVSPSAALHVLCLDEACRDILAGLGLPDVHLHDLKVLEERDPDLLRARGNRSLIEYYFTLTPCVPLHVFKTHPEVQRLTYVDADVFFFADPQPVLDEIGDHVVGLIEHRFPPELADRAQYGRFDVGWLTFRRDPIAIKCLETWREQCIEWCYDRLEPSRFAEHKYLDEWPSRFDRIKIVQHRGANVAPWNLNRFEISTQGGRLKVGGQPLLFFHAQGFAPKSPGRPRVLNLESYGIEGTPMLLRSIFEPYEAALLEATTEIAVPLALSLLADPSPGAVSTVETLKGQLSASEADRAARLDAISTLQGQLEASEADRKARLEVIHTQQKELDASQMDHAARLDAIQKLQSQLQASEADRAARLEVIQAQKKEMESSQADHAARLDVIHSMQARLESSEADGAARLVAIRTLEKTLEASRADHAARLDLVQTLKSQLETATADHAAKLEAIQALQKQLEVKEFDRSARMDVSNTLQRELEENAAHLKAIRSQLQEARTRLGDMERSRSWRWTQFVRWVEGWGRKVDRDDRDDEG